MGSLQSDMTSIFAHAEKHKNIIVHNLPKDYYAKLITAVANITVEDIQTTSEKYLSAEVMVEVAVG
jgi:predicted Zn-dependent peptidase